MDEGLQFTAAEEENPVVPSAQGDMTNELIATAARVVRAATNNQSLHMDRAVKV